MSWRTRRAAREKDLAFIEKLRNSTPNDIPILKDKLRDLEQASYHHEHAWRREAVRRAIKRLEAGIPRVI